MRRHRISKAISGVVGLALVMTFVITTTPPPNRVTLSAVKSAAQLSGIDRAGASSITSSRSLNRPAIASPSNTAPISVAAAPKKTSPPKPIRRYTIKGGDTLSQIAVDHRMGSWHPLAAANTDTVKNPDLIFIGQELRVPNGHQIAQVRKAKVPSKQAHRAHPVRKLPVAGSGSPQTIAKQLLASRGWSSQWGCLNSLINRESGWNVHADNPHSDAYGIPQSLPGSKMASAGSDWRDSVQTQLTWMMRYIHDRYGNPCGAWGHSQATGWY